VLCRHRKGRRSSLVEEMSKRTLNVLPADPEKWSAKSKQSVVYQLGFAGSKAYQDIEYTCWRCQAPSVFTAEQQREAFEVQEKYIDQRRILCADCWRVRRGLEASVREYRSRWKQRKPALQNDRPFLSRWLECLEALPGYSAARDTAGIAMLRRRIAVIEQR